MTKITKCSAKKQDNPHEITRVIFLGGALHGDDGLGPYAFELLSKAEWPEKLELLNGGTGGMALIPLFKDCNHVVLVDAFFNDDVKPGEILVVRNIRDDESIKVLDLNVGTFEHGGDAVSLLKLLPIYISEMPKISLIAISGIIFEGFSAKLSTEVENSIFKLEGIIKNLIKNES